MNALVDEADIGRTRPAPSPAGPPADGGLFSALSRGICNPLISLRAGFDLLLAGCEGPITESQRDQVQTLRSQCDALIGLTRSFLDYAEPAPAARPLDRSSFRLGALLAEADRQFSGSARARGINWSCRLVGEEGRVITDLACFQQVLGQLVANALAHTPDGGRIDVTGRLEAAGWLVEVADDGRGIPAQALDSVFEPLIRLGVGSPPGMAGGGHGMGLAVCRELVARLGGEIALYSAPGRGTTVSVRFPAGPAQDDDAS